VAPISLIKPRRQCHLLYYMYVLLYSHFFCGN